MKASVLHYLGTVGTENVPQMMSVQNLMKKEDFVAPSGDTVGKDHYTAMKFTQQMIATVLKTVQVTCHGVVMKAFALKVP